MPVITDIEPVAVNVDATESNGLYPIREVSRLTGINPVTLRAWERRYGFIEPKRTNSGHRLYSLTDIETVRRVQGWIERGVSVSKVGELLARGTPAISQHEGVQSTEYREWQLQISAALSAFNEAQLERLYGQIFSSYPPEVVFQDILMPLWHQLSKTRDEFGRTSEWLLLDGFLRGRVLHRLQFQLQVASASTCVVVIALPDLCRELELLVTGLLLSRADRVIRVLPMGQPLDELALVCEKIQPAGVVVFAQRALSTAHHRRLLKLGQTLDCPTLLAGEAANVAQPALCDSSIGCLGHDARVMSQRLDAELKGHVAF